jgi:hypothetical protein
VQDFEELQSFRAQLLLPEQRQLFDYWLAQSGDRPMPDRSEISPLHFARLLPNISLIDVAAEIGESRIRLAGTRLRDVYDREITGLVIGQLFVGDRQDYWMTAFRHTIMNRRPTQGVVRGPHCAKDHLVHYWLKLPLATGQQNVGMVLCLDSFLRSAEESAVQQLQALA